MKHVTFAPVPGEFQGGEQRLVPDELAQQLKKDGKITVIEDWPPAPTSPAPEAAAQPSILPDRRAAAPLRRAAHPAPRRAR